MHDYLLWYAYSLVESEEAVADGLLRYAYSLVESEEAVADGLLWYAYSLVESEEAVADGLGAHVKHTVGQHGRLRLTQHCGERDTTVMENTVCNCTLLYIATTMEQECKGIIVYCKSFFFFAVLQFYWISQITNKNFMLKWGLAVKIL